MARGLVYFAVERADIECGEGNVIGVGRRLIRDVGAVGSEFELFFLPLFACTDSGFCGLASVSDLGDEFGGDVGEEIEISKLAKGGNEIGIFEHIGGNIGVLTSFSGVEELGEEIFFDDSIFFLPVTYLAAQIGRNIRGYVRRLRSGIRAL